MLFPRQKVSRRRKTASTNAEYQSLEQRLALTTFVVNTTIDDASGNMDGLVSFREALIAANTNAAFGDAAAGAADGDAIRFDATAIGGGTIGTANGQYVISDDVLIQGGAADITFDGGDSDRIFQDLSDERVVFSNLTFENGSAATGGAITSLSGGTTVVVGSEFSNNEATGQGGGAIFHSGGDLYVVDSDFDSNLANGGAGSGGALLSVTGLTSVTGGSMTSNVANRAGGAIEVVDGLFYMSDVTVGTEGAGNVAGPDGSEAPGNGGGLHVTADARVVVTGGSFVGNTAASEGGGLWNQSNALMFIRGGAEISGNVAMGVDADNGGGGVFNNGGNVYVSSSIIANNSASGSSGSGGGFLTVDGVLNIRDTSIEMNLAARAGGGIEAIDGTTFLSNTDLTANEAGGSLVANPGNGGGMHVSGSSLVIVENGSEINSNFAASEGGGLWNEAGATMIIRGNTVISGNRASGDDSDNGGGGIFNNGGRVYASNMSIDANFADGDSGSGGGIFSTAGPIILNNVDVTANQAARAGGGIELVDGYLRVTDSELSANDAGVTLTAAPGNGGGVHVTGSATSIIENTDVLNNVAAAQGAGLWNQDGSNLLIRNGSRIANNAAAGLSPAVGGGVYNKGYINVADSFFESNTSTSDGGGLFATDTATGRVEATSLLTNTSSERGGGIFNSGTLNVIDSVFTGNVATIDGGGYFTDAGGTTNVSGGSASGNLPNTSN